ncbi:MAG: hypothetical protein ABSB35_03720 [Bryobacteraceae bacterium]|jgi:hypothetical protein
MKNFAFVALFGLVSGIIAAAQAYAPMVNMNVVLPNGEMKQVSAPESGLAVVTLADGTEYGFRPTILDSQPWHRVTVTIFKMAAGSESTQELGEVEVRTGAAPVHSKTAPTFKIAVTNIGPAIT